MINFPKITNVQTTLELEQLEGGATFEDHHRYYGCDSVYMVWVYPSRYGQHCDVTVVDTYRGIKSTYWIGSKDVLQSLVLVGIRTERLIWWVEKQLIPVSDREKATEPENTRKRRRQSYVYFLQAEGDGLIKIGRTINPDKRVRELQTLAPSPLKLLALVEGGKDREREIHEMFVDARSHGEWFEPTPQLLRFIQNHSKERARY